MSDREVLVGLLGSVYLTERQKRALAALLRESGKREAEKLGAREGHSPRWREDDVIGAPGTALEDEQRHALLGPCGAE